MKPNVGDKERLYRTIFGVYGILLGFFFLQGVIGAILGVLSLVSLFTGLTGWCALYHFMGKSTLEVPTQETEKEGNDVD
jgi:hypothetical protein